VRGLSVALARMPERKILMKSLEDLAAPPNNSAGHDAHGQFFSAIQT